MTINFKNASDVITYALERIISSAWNNQPIFVAQCNWCLEIRSEAHQIPSAINLDLDIIHPDMLSQVNFTDICDSESIKLEITGIKRQDPILEDCETFLLQSELNWSNFTNELWKLRRQE